MLAVVDLIQSFFLDFMEKHKVYFRGALSFGQFLFSQSERIVLGQALIEAYELYESTDWIGVILTPSAEKVLHDIVDLGEVPYDWYADFVKYHIPYKSGVTSGGNYAINWMSRYNHRTDKEDALRRIKNAMPPLNDLDENVRSKYVNTLKFIETAIDYNMFSV